MLPLHSTFSHEPNAKIVIIENVCLIHMPFFLKKSLMSPFTTTRSKTTQSTSMVRIDLGSMEKKPKEINLGLMVGGPTKELEKENICI